ncbi:MAG: hypothetical protein FWB80_13035 [Defluviitaleaceae bacterium]|nr:hypothetical protein [Defluviitaleaceae bacterium]
MMRTYVSKTLLISIAFLVLVIFILVSGVIISESLGTNLTGFLFGTKDITVPANRVYYTVTATIDGEDIVFGEMTIDYNRSEDGTATEIIETRTFAGAFFSEYEDEVINERTFLFRGNELWMVSELETVSGEINMARSLNTQLSYGRDYRRVGIANAFERVDGVIKLIEVDSENLHEFFYLPYSPIPVSAFLSERFYMASLGLDAYDEFTEQHFFFYNINGYIEVFSHVRNEIIDTTLGSVAVAVVEMKGDITTTLWIDNNGLILRIREVFDPGFALNIEIQSYH